MNFTSKKARRNMNRFINTCALAISMSVLAVSSYAADYPTPVPLQDGAQAPIDAIKPKNESDKKG